MNCISTSNKTISLGFASIMLGERSPGRVLLFMTGQDRKNERTCWCGGLGRDSLVRPAHGMVQMELAYVA